MGHFRFVMTIQALQNEPQPDPHFRGNRIEFDRFREMGQGGLVVSRFPALLRDSHQGDHQIAARFDVVRLNRQDAAERFGGVLGATLFAQLVAEIVPSGGKRWSQFHRPAEGGHRLAGLLRRPQSAPQIELRLAGKRIERRRLAQLGHRPVQLPHLHQRRPQVVVGRRVLRGQLDRFRELRRRILKLPTLKADQPQRMPRRRMPRFRHQNPPVSDLRAGQVTGTMPGESGFEIGGAAHESGASQITRPLAPGKRSFGLRRLVSAFCDEAC